MAKYLKISSLDAMQFLLLSFSETASMMFLAAEAVMVLKHRHRLRLNKIWGFFEDPKWAQKQAFHQILLSYQARQAGTKLASQSLLQGIRLDVWARVLAGYCSLVL